MCGEKEHGDTGWTVTQRLAFEARAPIRVAPLPRQDVMRDIAAEMFFRRATTIYGGTSEIQRGIVAKALFGF